MSDSIRGDYKFVKLLKRFLDENKEIMASTTFQLSRRFYDTMGMSMDFVNFNSKIKRLEDQADTTLKHIFKYIDRYAERKVLSDRAFQKHENSIKEVGELKTFLDRLKVTPDGICYIHKDWCQDRTALEYLRGAIVTQIIKINPSLVLLPKFYIDFKYNNFAPCPILKVSVSFDNSGGIQHIVNEFYGTKSDHFNDGDRFVIDLTKFAKYVSDEVNKIAREKKDRAYDPHETIDKIANEMSKINPLMKFINGYISYKFNLSNGTCEFYFKCGEIIEILFVLAPSGGKYNPDPILIANYFVDHMNALSREKYASK